MTELFEELKNSGIILSGHFRLRSGKHSDLYINKDLILTKPALFRNVLIEFQYKISNLIHCISNSQLENLVITGPAVAGAIFSAPLSYMSRIPLVYPEKVEVSGVDTMLFRRGFDSFLSGKSVILIEDIVTTGDSILQTIDAVEKCKGIILRTFSLWDRGSYLSDIISYDSLINRAVPSWFPAGCPLCKNHVKFTPNPKGEK